MIRIQSGGEVFVAREGERLQPIGRVVSVEWNLNRPNVIDVEQTRPIVGYDPAAPEQPYMTAIVRGLAHGVARRRRRPGKLNETHEDFLTLQTHRRYPKRIDLARERHRFAELNRRDRRRRRTGRAAIGLQGPVEVRTRLPRVQIAPPEIDGHLRLIADQWATLQVRMNAAVRDINRSFAAMSQAFANAFSRSTLEGIADRVLTGPYITVDELRRQIEFEESRRADRERYYNERIRGGQIARQTRLATGGFVSPPRAPDDDSIPVRISPGEVWCTPDMARRLAPGLLQHLNAPAQPFHARPRDVTHHDQWLGEGALDRDETSSVHSTDSSGTGAVWSGLMARIDDLVDGKE